MIQTNIPTDAVQVKYEYGKERGVIYLWQSPSGWYWHAVGGDGKEKTSSQALTQARRWIQDRSIKE